MPDDERKKPFHEVVSFQLLTIPIGITGILKAEKQAELALLLSILVRSKMPAAAAHEIAETHHQLPKKLREVGLTFLAGAAETVFKDLEGRQDEPKKEAETAT